MDGLPGFAGGPGLTAVAQAWLYAALSSPTTIDGGPGLNVGASLTGATQIRIVAGAEYAYPSNAR